MRDRDYQAAPLSERLGLGDIISGLAGDIVELREGKITVNDALARAQLAKQVFNGVRIYMNGAKLLEQNAKALNVTKTPIQTTGQEVHHD